MHFTGEWFQGLIKNLKTNAPGAGEHKRRPEGEQRKQARVGLRFSTQMMVFEKGRATRFVHIHVRDISPAGIGLIHNRMLPTGCKFMIELPMKDGKALQVLCQVINCRTLDNKLYGIGATIVSTNVETAGAVPASIAQQLAKAVPSPSATVPPATQPLAATITESIDSRIADLRKRMFDAA